MKPLPKPAKPGVKAKPFLAKQPKTVDDRPSMKGLKGC